jgi:hypothetical protein
LNEIEQVILNRLMHSVIQKVTNDTKPANFFSPIKPINYTHKTRITGISEQF